MPIFNALPAAIDPTKIFTLLSMRADPETDMRITDMIWKTTLIAMYAAKLQTTL